MNKMMGACTSVYRLIQTISITNDKKVYSKLYQTMILYEIQRISRKQDQGDCPHHCSLTEYVLTNVGTWMALANGRCG